MSKVTVFDVVSEYDAEVARHFAGELPLADQLRASIARNEGRPTVAHEDLYEAIEKRRSELLENLEEARAAREQINKNIKAAQDALDALPVPKTRRVKKPTTEQVAAGMAAHIATHVTALAREGV